MAPIFNMVSKINPSKDKCALKLQVVRMYEKDVYGNSNEKTFEIVFHDREEADKEMFPIRIESLIGKKVLFKVQVKSENIRMRSDVFTVMQLTEDSNVIARYVVFGDQRQESDIFSKLEKTEVDNEKVFG
ncbi:hypothetical protein LguiA_019250 [Lonicera macranthoides]